MKVYIAAPYVAREQIVGYAAELTRVGFTVTSRWIEETHEIGPGTAGAATDVDAALVAKHALDDLEDIRDADLFVMVTAEHAVMVNGAGGNSGGRHVETGYAIAKMGVRQIVIVGEPENIFHRMAGVTVVPNWHEAVIELSSRLVDDRRPRAEVAS